MTERRHRASLSSEAHPTGRASLLDRRARRCLAAAVRVSSPPLSPPSALRAVEPCPTPRTLRARWVVPTALVGAGVLWLAAAAAVPSLALGLAVVATALAAVHAALQARALGRLRGRAVLAGRPVRSGQALSFVSVHVPICNEPPALVCRTLSALAAMDGAFEVLVLDNNTRDRALWLPVRDHCTSLGPRFRFEHVGRLDGAKAGALTRCLDKTDPRATHILVVDADYAVEPDLLARAAAAVAEAEAEGRRVGAVQFPQAYANTAGAEGMALAYRRYFQTALPAAEEDGAALLTGTLSVIARDALVAAGGWSARTITEDADLGARLHAAGYDVVVETEPVGRGLMPSDLCALRAQRRRWVCGNAQALRQRAVRRQGAAVWHQLTYWASPLGPLGLVLLTVAVTGAADPVHRLAAQVAGAGAAGWLLARLAATWRGSPRAAVRAWLSERGLAWEALTAVWEGGLGARLPFVRTSKDLGSGRVRGAGPTLGVALAFAVAGAVLALRGAPVAGALSIGVGVATALGLAVLIRELRAAGRAAVPVHAEAASVLAEARPIAS